MMPLRVKQILVTERVRSPEARRRADRIAAATISPSTREVDDAQLADYLDEEMRGRAGRTGQVRSEEDLTLILNAFAWPAPEELEEKLRRYPVLRRVPMLLGQGAWGFRDAGSLRRTHNGVCQSAYEVHCAWGCYHDCRYCHIGNQINIMLNLEELTGRLEGLMDRVPWQRLYKFDNYTDQICFEPELGASRVMVDFFARQPDRYLMLYTRSDNVDHLLDLDHRGHTLVSWSLSTDTQAEMLEKKAPSPSERIDAIRRCQEAGYRVRCRISPIVPLDGWESDMQRMLKRLFDAARPDLLSIDVLGWMTARQMNEAIDISQFDAEARSEVEALLESEPDKHPGKHLFSHGLRKRILSATVEIAHALSPETPVSICMETPEMWADMADRLGMQPGGQVCCCAPTSVPGHPLLAD